MPHNLLWFRGEIRSIVDIRFEMLGAGFIDDAIDFGQWECFKNLVNQYGGHFRVTKLVDIAANKDRYPYPSDLFKMTCVERADLDADSWVQLEEGTFHQRDDSVYGRYWSPLNDSELVIRPVPLTLMADGMRLTYIRKPKKMVQGADVCDLPEHSHYGVIFKAIDQLLLKPGVTLASPEKFEMVRGEFFQTQNQVVKPLNETQAPDITDNDPY